MKIFNGITGFLTLVGSCLGWFLGGWDGFLYALLTFCIVDYLTGVMLAIIDKKISSKIGFRGIFKKVFMFALVGIANIADKNIIGNGEAIRTAVIFFYLGNEGISILENTTKIGLPVPDKLKNILETMNKKVKK